MRITDLYKKNREVPWITLGVVFICLAVTFIAIIRPDMYEGLAWSNTPEYIWQYVSGVFLHGTGDSVSMAIAHLLANLCMFLPYAIMIEKLVGHKKFAIIFLCSWIGVSVTFQIIARIISKGKPAYGAGLSGSAYTMIAIGAFVLFKVFLLDKKKFFRQFLSYFFIFGLIGEILMLRPDIAGGASMAIHITGVIIGMIMVIIFNKTLLLNVNRIAGEQK